MDPRLELRVLFLGLLHRLVQLRQLGGPLLALGHAGQDLFLQTLARRLGVIEFVLQRVVFLFRLRLIELFLILGDLAVFRLEGQFLAVGLDLEVFDRVLRLAIQLFLVGDLRLLRLLLPRRPIDLLLQFVAEAAQTMNLAEEDGGTRHYELLSAISAQLSVGTR